MIFGTYGETQGLDSPISGYGPVAGKSEHGTETSGCKKDNEFHNVISDYERQKVSAP
jgi:hypothetical protein